MRRIQLLTMGMVAAAALSGCGASITTYVRPDTSWDTIGRVAVVPLMLASENPVRREQLTQLLATELRKSGFLEVVEVSVASPLGILPTIEEVAKTYEVDAVVSGSVDEAQGTSIQLSINDALTGELLWSSSYLLSVGPEFFSTKTPQQKMQRAFRSLIKRYSRTVASL